MDARSTPGVAVAAPTVVGLPPGRSISVSPGTARATAGRHGGIAMTATKARSPRVTDHAISDETGGGPGGTGCGTSWRGRTITSAAAAAKANVKKRTARTRARRRRLRWRVTRVLRGAPGAV